MKKKLLEIVKKPKIESKNLLEKILETTNFQYDEFLCSLPKEIWKLIFLSFEENHVNSLLLVSKSFFHFLHLNPPFCFKTIYFLRWSTYKKYYEQRILATIMLPRFSQLNQLGFLSCVFTKNILVAILGALKYLVQLDFSGCSLETEERLDVIIEYIKINPILETLIFWCNDITSKGFQELCDTLQISPFIKKLTIHEDRINAKEIIIFAEFLKTNSSLEYLWISYIEDVREIKVLFESLEINKTLKIIKINVNRITDEDAKYIAKVLKVNKSLQHLDFSGCDIEIIGVRCIFEALKVNTTLQLLDLRCNWPNGNKEIFIEGEFEKRVVL